ncbi:MAG: uL15 family ribosomal protein [Candidatus Woesearchaeota archaeon]
MAKRKKVTRLRGSKTHGGGSMKKRRGAGNRGGRGNAGSGKRGDAKKPSYWSDATWFGMYGFKSKSKASHSAVNVSDLEKISNSLEINLSEKGISKLLGAGKVLKPFVVTVEKASPKAIDKINAVKGKVIIISNNNTSETINENDTN